MLRYLILSFPLLCYCEGSLLLCWFTRIISLALFVVPLLIISTTKLGRDWELLNCGFKSEVCFIWGLDPQTVYLCQIGDLHSPSSSLMQLPVILGPWIGAWCTAIPDCVAWSSNQSLPMSGAKQFARCAEKISQSMHILADLSWCILIVRLDTDPVNI